MTPEARERHRVRNPVLAVTAIAWTAMLVLDSLHAGSGSGMAGMGSGSTVASSGHSTHSMGTLSSQALTVMPVTFVSTWPLMMAAMMSPLLIPALRHVNARCLPQRRWRSTTLMTAAYVGIWMAGGLLLQGVATSVRAMTPEGVLPILIALAAAMCWQMSPAKQRCLNRKHGHPSIAAFGRAADVQALRLGLTHAVWCFGSCWGLMLLPLISDTGHLAMMVSALWMWAEQFDTPVVPTWRAHVPVTAARIVAATVTSPHGTAARSCPGSPGPASPR